MRNQASTSSPFDKLAAWRWDLPQARPAVGIDPPDANRNEAHVSVVPVISPSTSTHPRRDEDVIVILRN
jgi:hypothetical protein